MKQIQIAVSTAVILKVEVKSPWRERGGECPGENLEKTKENIYQPRKTMQVKPLESSWTCASERLLEIHY